MDTPFAKIPMTGERIVYVRQVEVADLPLEVREQAEGMKTIYAVHRSDGACLALVADKRLAFALAREHDLAPVSVH
jgi:hypothetical protein